MKNSWPVFLFLTALVLPWVIVLGPLRLSPYRLVLLVMVLPCLVIWITGGAGRKTLADFAVLLFALWIAVSLTVLHGLTTAAEPAGIGFIEAAGAYLLARCYVRNADDFRNAIQLLFRTVIFLMPFAIIEFSTGYNMLREALGTLAHTFDYPSETRSGFTRVLSVFEHPILFGLYAGSTVALAHLVLGYRQSPALRMARSGACGATALMSLSAGPMGAVAVQAFLLSWNGVLRKVSYRWSLLIGIVLGLVLLLDIAAKRSVPNIVTSFFLFDSQSYWYRKLIWDYGSASVMNNPLFGVGLHDWERPAWMPAASIDNFWLFNAVQYGLPAAFLLVLALLSTVTALSLKKGLDDRAGEYRTALVISLVFFFLTGWAVHFWDNVYVLFLFLMGAGGWVVNSRTRERSLSNFHRSPSPQGHKGASLGWPAGAQHLQEYVGSSEGRTGQTPKQAISKQARENDD